MNKVAFSALEKEMSNFNFDELQSHAASAKTNIAAAQNAADVKSEICRIWGKIGKYIKPLENVPIAGKFVKILADLLDSLCG